MPFLVVVLAAVVLLFAGARGHQAVAVESCAPPDADPLLVGDRKLEGAIAVGPLVLYPADGLPVRGQRVMGPKAVMITTEPVTVAVGRAARRRFSLLFAGATTGYARTGFRVRDGIAAVRLTTCGRDAMGFRGGLLYRGAQCVLITVRPDTGPASHATLAIGRNRSTCN